MRGPLTGLAACLDKIASVRTTGIPLFLSSCLILPTSPPFKNQLSSLFWIKALYLYLVKDIIDNYEVPFTMKMR